MDPIFQKFLKVAKNERVTLKQFLEFSHEFGFPYLGNLARNAFLVVSQGKNEIFLRDLDGFVEVARNDCQELKSQIVFKFLSDSQEILSFNQFCSNARTIQKLYKKLRGVGKRLTDSECRKAFQVFEPQMNGISFEQFHRVFIEGSCFVEWNKFILFDLLQDRSTDPEEIECYFELIISALTLNAKRCKELVFFNTLPSTPTQNSCFNLAALEPQISWTDFKEKIVLAASEAPKDFFNALTENLSRLSRLSLPILAKNNQQDLHPCLSWFLLSGVFQLFQLKPSRSLVQTSLKERKILTSYKITSHFSPKLRELLTASEIKEILKETSVQKAVLKSILEDFSVSPWIKSAGKSSGSFLLTDKQKFLFKSLQDSEFEFLTSFLESYSDFVRENPETFICKIFGVFTLKKFKSWKTYKFRFLMMKFLLRGFNDSDLVFDLKGSTFGRSNRSCCQLMNPLKDENFIEKGLQVHLNESDKTKVFEQLAKDCEFFKRLSIIDYSLIVGIKEVSCGAKIKKNWILSECGRFYYVFGIIDYFTVFGYRKQLEMFFKNSLFGEGVSCCPPDQYAERFLEFLKKNFI